MIMRRLSSSLILLLLLASCRHNPITGRSHLALFPESVLQMQSLTQYRTFLSQNRVVPKELSKDAEMVKRVGSKIAKVVTDYYNKQGLAKELNGYNWEFNLIDNREVNAWCMPGGKVVVYTGLLPVTQNEAALAAVLGHEITHALAHHGNERMSQAVLAQGLQIAGDIFTQNRDQANAIFNSVFAPTAQLAVLLPNSRKHEYEADRFGIMFSAMAGYNPVEAIAFWQRMSKAGGPKPPEFLATHPSDANRIAQLQKHMDEAILLYKSAK